MRRLRCLYPTTAQTYLMSATLSPGVLELKRLLLNKPVVVKLEDEDDEEDGGAVLAASSQRGPAAAPSIDQYYIPCRDDAERYCYLWALIRLGHVTGKVLVFVDQVDRAYRVKLFLERFGVQAAVLNHDVPLNSRNHIVQQFNTGGFSTLVATDESVKRIEQAEREARRKRKRERKSAGKKGAEDDDAAAGAAAKGAASEYGVARGIDFREVTAVISFDLFASLTEDGCKSYVHRVGRTGRAGKEGTAVSFVGADDDERADGWVRYLNGYLGTRGQSLARHPMCDDPEQALSLLYRTTDVLQSIKKRAVRDAKLRELASEALASERLQQHFTDNPSDLQALRHIADRTPSQQKQASALSYLPSYLNAGKVGHMETSQPAAPCHAAGSDSDDDAVGGGALRRKKRRRRAADPLRDAAQGAAAAAAAAPAAVGRTRFRTGKRHRRAALRSPNAAPPAVSPSAPTAASTATNGGGAAESAGRGSRAAKLARLKLKRRKRRAAE